jgi:hypothetical protein
MASNEHETGLDPEEREALNDAWKSIRRELEDWATAEGLAAGLLRRPSHSPARPLSDVGGSPDGPVPMLAEDLLPVGQIVSLCAEEGTGKTWAEHQWACELAAGRPVAGAFAVPSPVRSLIVDVEQSQEDVRIIRDEMMRRGILGPDLPVFWLEAADRAFDVPEDQAWLIEQVAAMNPDVVWIDTATDAVTDPMDDKAVRRAMALYRWFVRETPVRAVVLLAQPRKQGQGADAKGRSFDSLFGSRVWKSKPSAVFWMTENRLTVWKQRGNYLRKRYGKPSRANPWAAVERPATGSPMVVHPPEWAAEQKQEAKRTVAEERRADAVKFVAEEPDVFSRSSLAQKVGGTRARTLELIDKAIAAGALRTTPNDRLAVGDPTA